MIEQGDWITPHYNYEYRFQKPVFFYWLVALSFLAAGIGEAAARFPAALAGLGLALVTCGCGRRWLGARAGLHRRRHRRLELRLLHHRPIVAAGSAAGVLHHARHLGTARGDGRRGAGPRPGRARRHRPRPVDARRGGGHGARRVDQGPRRARHSRAGRPRGATRPAAVAAAVAGRLARRVVAHARGRCRRPAGHRPAVVHRDGRRAWPRLSRTLLRRREPRAIRDRSLQRPATVLVLRPDSARWADAPGRRWSCSGRCRPSR